MSKATTKKNPLQNYDLIIERSFFFFFPIEDRENLIRAI